MHINLTLPVKLVEQLNKEVPSGKRARFVQEAIEFRLGDTMPARTEPKGNKLDLTHVFANGDLDVAQSHSTICRRKRTIT